MRLIALLTALFCLCLTSCHRPAALFQRTPHAAARLPMSREPATDELTTDSFVNQDKLVFNPTESGEPAVVSSRNQPVTAVPAAARVRQRMNRIQSVLSTSVPVVDQQPRPRPKPKNKLRLGNRIRQELGIPLREELTWWQRISWKLKASVIVILVALVFALFKVTILAVIFGLLGAFLLITGLKRSFKTRRPWF